MKRSIKDVQGEIKARQTAYERHYGNRTFSSFLPLLMSKNELESLTMIYWLEGYLQALKDERKGKKK